MHDETVTRITPTRSPESGPCLCVIEGPSGGSIVFLGNADVTIGRHPQCDLVLESGAVSKRHAKVSCCDGEYSLQDLASTNGTMVNALPLVGEAPRALCHGDVILIGDHTLIFRQDSEERPHKRGMSTISFDAAEVREEADRLMDDWMKDE